MNTSVIDLDIAKNVFHFLSLAIWVMAKIMPAAVIMLQA